METKILTFDPKLKLMGGKDGAPRRIGFYLSTFGNWDRVRPVPERPSRDAFDKHLDTFLRDGFVTEFHDWGKRPIASPDVARADDYGLWVEAEFHSTNDAEQAYITYGERLSRGKSVKTSMGYDVLGDEYVDIDDPGLQAEGVTTGRILTDVPLYEASIVNVPANPLADVTTIKGMLQAGIPFDGHYQAAQAAVETFVARAKELQALRAKEGRELSSSNRQKLSDLRTSLQDVFSILDELLARTEPEAKAGRGEILAEFQRFQVLSASVRELQRSLQR
jgi:HK97 family phage prohead protease